MQTKRGQLSTEYLVIVGFISFLVIGLLAFSLFYTSSVQDSIRMSNLAQFASKVVVNAESVYYAGEPSRVVVIATLPTGVTSIQVLPNEIVFKIETGSGLSVISYSSNVPLQGSISSHYGVKRITLEAGESSVIIKEG